MPFILLLRLFFCWYINLYINKIVSSITKMEKRMKKMGRPKKDASEVKITTCFCITKQNRKKVVALAKDLKTSVSQVVNKIIEDAKS